MNRIELPPPDARRLLGIIAGAISSGRIREGDPRTFLSYSELLERLHEKSSHIRPGPRLRKRGLDALNDWTIRHPEVPKLTALIVAKQTRLPGKGFPESHGFQADDPHWPEWWLDQANRAIRYDWTPFLGATVIWHEQEPSPGGLHVREEVEPSQVDYRGIIEVDPPPAHIRQSRITVGDILRWLAAGTPESEILRRHPELRGTDIRASLAYAAEREDQSTAASKKLSSLSNFTTRWTGKFKLPEADPSDPRLTYLLNRYERSGE